MHQVQDEPMETLHIYLEREQPPQPSLLPIILSVFLSVLALSLFIALCVFVPFQQPVTRAVIRVPAVPLAIKTFTAQAAIIPTGVKTYPATTAHGWLTFSNGSIIGQSVPVGYVIGNFVTDWAVFVPPGDANGYGYARVSAHAQISGKQGNIPALAINSVIGSSLYIRNLSAFSGGRDAYSVKVVTAQDKWVALMKARDVLTLMSTGLHYPCSEITSGALKVTWRCQMLTYHIAAFYHVTGARLIGKNLLISVWFIPRPVRYLVK